MLRVRPEPPPTKTKFSYFIPTFFCFTFRYVIKSIPVVLQVPLKDSTVDIAVFCLSLMGTNLSSYLREANRVLKPK